jgi:hypothetical protein
MIKDPGVSLTLRSSVRASALYQNRLELTVCEDGRVIGRIHENPRVRSELRWFWLIAVPAPHQQERTRSYPCTSEDSTSIQLASHACDRKGQSR